MSIIRREITNACLLQLKSYESRVRTPPSGNALDVMNDGERKNPNIPEKHPSFGGDWDQAGLQHSAIENMVNSRDSSRSH